MSAVPFDGNEIKKMSKDTHMAKNKKNFNEEYIMVYSRVTTSFSKRSDLKRERQKFVEKSITTCATGSITDIFLE